LLKVVPSEGPKDQASGKRVHDFLRRACRLGALLDQPADRKFAQGVLEYWGATLYEAARDGAAQMTRLPPEETCLAPFDEGRVKAVVDRAEEAVRSLASRHGHAESAARRLLLRLVRLPEEGTSVTAVAVPRLDLLSGYDAEIMGQVIEALVAAEALVLEEDG